MTVQEFKINATKKLALTSKSPALDVEIFLTFCLRFTKTQVLMQRDAQIEPEKLSWLENAVEQRSHGLPVAYITGHKEFYGYDFFVTPDVLIPKPDTEILVERATQAIAQKIAVDDGRPLSVCDMFTGSGCIALSVAKNLLENFAVSTERLPNFTLADISENALKIAQKNQSALFNASDGLPCPHFSFIRSNLFDAIAPAFDVILANPPYVPAALAQELLKDGRSEPILALDGDVTADGRHSASDDGLEVIRNFLPQAKNHLAPHGMIFMEAGEYNAEDAAKIARKLGFKTRIHKDLEDQLRVLELE